MTAARELRTRLSGRSQAVVVTVASEGLAAERLHAAEVLADLLIRLGEPALLVPEQAHAGSASATARGATRRSAAPSPSSIPPAGSIG